MVVRIRAGRPQPKTIMAACNTLLDGSGWVVRDWQIDSLLEPLPLNRRFTLELTSGDDWSEVPDLYALHAELLAKHSQKQTQAAT